MKRMKILVAYDGSDCANEIIDDLKRAGLPREAEAVVISVADLILPPPPPSSYEIVEAALSDRPSSAAKMAVEREAQAVEQARVIALEACDRLLTYFPQWEVRAEARADTPAWAVIKKADEWGPDLVVVGSHGRSGLGRFFLGSVSQQVVTEARCSVRIARFHNKPDDHAVRIVIGIDGSPGAEAAAHAVAKRVWPVGSEARVVTVLGPLMVPALEWIEENHENEWAWACKMHERVTERLKAAGLNVTSVVKQGDPKRVLLDEAEEWGADSIFVGARGLRRLERFLLGSVSTAVAARAHCSVEVVRPGKQPS